jgi:hypothetical protein
VDAFWSVTIYNRDGCLEANPYDSHSRNSVTSVADSGEVARRGGPHQPSEHHGWLELRPPPLQATPIRHRQNLETANTPASGQTDQHPLITRNMGGLGLTSHRPTCAVMGGLD